MARQRAKRQRPGCREREHAAGLPQLPAEKLQVGRVALDVPFARHDEQRGPLGRCADGARKQACGAGETMQRGAATGAQRLGCRAQRGLLHECRCPRRVHVRRTRASSSVVDSPGRSGTRSTTPPAAATSARPTIRSSAQSAPFTSTSGSSASIARSGVSSS